MKSPKNRQAALSALDQLRALAEAVISSVGFAEFSRARDSFRDVLDPETVIAILEEVDILRKQAQSTDALRSALKFYANPESYELTDMDDMGTCASPIDLDGGDRAQKALEPAGKEGEE